MVPAGLSLAPMPEFSSIDLHLSIGSMTRPFLQALAPGCPFHYGTFLSAALMFPPPRQASQQCSSSRAALQKLLHVSETFSSSFCYSHSSCVHQLTGPQGSAALSGPFKVCPGALFSPPPHSLEHLRALLPSIIEAQGLCSPAHLPTAPHLKESS